MTAAVELAHATKRFRRGESHDSLRAVLSAYARRLTGRARSRSADTFTALRDVSLSVHRGEAVGVIGPNGAGKSTILKLLAGILRPDGGRVSIHGRLAALIEVGAGFHGDLTGRENIMLNGTILGMSRAEIRSKMDAIVAFAGLERFLDMPVKRYSSGMYARLGFSIAAHVDPDVLLIDEVLSVGDAVFRLRCLDRMRSLVARGTTLVFVTHDLDQMQTICRRAVVLRDGCVSFDGAAGNAVGYYMQAMARAYTERPTDLCDGEHDRAIDHLQVRLLNEDGDVIEIVGPGAPVRIHVSFRARDTIARLVCEANLRAATGNQLISINSGRDETFFRVAPGAHEITLALASVPLAPGQYFWNLRLWNADTGATLVDTPFRYPLAVDRSAIATGALCLPHEWVIRASLAQGEITAPPTNPEARSPAQIGGGV